MSKVRFSTEAVENLRSHFGNSKAAVEVVNAITRTLEDQTSPDPRLVSKSAQILTGRDYQLLPLAGDGSNRDRYVALVKPIYSAEVESASVWNRLNQSKVPEQFLVVGVQPESSTMLGALGIDSASLK